MPSKTRLSIRGRLYVACVVLAGTGALLQSVYSLLSTPIPHSWLVFAALTLFSGSFAIKLPSVPARISVSETFVFTAVLLYGGAPGTIIVALDGLIISLWRRDRLFHRIAFNATEPAISIWVASYIFFTVSGVQPLSQTPASMGSLVVPLLAFTVTYFALNSWLTAVAVSFQTGIQTFVIWRQHFLWISLNYFAGASVAVLLARNTSNVDYSTLTVILPLLVISYLTFKTALQRVEDARSHVAKLNALYLSTIETFALWIDAKDQVTHGHIRRVQRYALGLAAELGVRDDQLLKAIEAAALLHDMGKLAVPEHILNKPGKLTSGEFEKMKLHSSIGAQILSSIDFPYPVVPIVRHHHENWDGSGYPDHLAGTEIPIGARVLAVVDCFDALTSDRPYRGKLTDEQALEILRERRGTMYDPIVVDAFVKVHDKLRDELTSTAAKTQDEAASAVLPSKQRAEAHRHQSEHDRREGVIALLQLAKSLAGRAGLADTADVVVRHLLEVLPTSLVVMFVYNPETDELHAVCERGVGEEAVRGLRVQVGSGVSGWVAANRQEVAGSDPSLEFAELHSEALESLQSVYSTPLLVGSELVGVLSLYSQDRAGLSNSILRTVALLRPHVSRAMQQAAAYEKAEVARERERASHSGLHALAELGARADRSSPSLGQPLTVVFLEFDPSASSRFIKAGRAGVRRHVSRVARENLRPPDLLLRYTDNSFVVLLGEGDAAAAAAITRRMASSIGGTSFMSGEGQRVAVTVQAGFAVAPADGESLDGLIAAARRRAREDQERTGVIC